MKPLLKQAEQKVVNRAKAYNDILSFVDALANFGNTACHEHVAKAQFFEGLKLMRTAIRAEQSEAIRECFYFVGVGGEEAAAYSRALFKRAFGSGYQIMDFLDTWGNVPSCYKAADREAFQAECDEVIENIK